MTSSFSKYGSRSNPINLSWRYLSASIGQKKILNECSGFAKPGQMLTIMGASGAGKTTLLSILCQRSAQKLKIEGEVKANGRPFNSKSFSNFGVYIYQHDTLHEMMTVKETLAFIATLKFKNKLKALKKIEELISLFELQNCQDSLVGSTQEKGISGGEKKRLCIALEMVSNPAMLILDEPTSGLDSNKATKVIKILKKLAVTKQCTIVFTIHQPSYLLYSNLDKLLLLNKGRNIYYGQASEVQRYLSKTLLLSIPINTSISDFFMMEMSVYKEQRDGRPTLMNFQNYRRHLEIGLETQITNIESNIQITARGYNEKDIEPSFFYSSLILMKRQWLIFWRTPRKTIGTVALLLLGIIIVGLFYFNSITPISKLEESFAKADIDEFTLGWIETQGVSFVIVMSFLFQNCNNVVLTFPVHRQVYYKQNTSRKYKSLPYYLVKICIELMNGVVAALFYTSAVYFLCGYSQSVSKWLNFVLMAVILSFVGNSVGMFLGCLFQDPKMASRMTPLVFLPMVVLSGIYNKIAFMPVWIRWLSYISPARYGLHIIFLNQYGDVIFTNPIFGDYDYKKDFEITLSLHNNYLVMTLIAIFFYILGFVMLKRLTSKLAA